jgi:transcriptional regulator with XRE-family HTH domain
MITCIREVRRTKGMTLQDVADACSPPTMAQTIGRLETGTRTVSVGWLNRIAKALDVDASELVRLPDRTDLPVAAVLSAEGAVTPRHAQSVVPPRPAEGAIAILVDASVGDYRHGDVLWCDRIWPDDYGAVLNRDVLVPRPAGRYVFGRLIGREGTKLQILPPGHGARQQVIPDAPWLAVASRLIRALS